MKDQKEPQADADGFRSPICYLATRRRATIVWHDMPPPELKRVLFCTIVNGKQYFNFGMFVAGEVVIGLEKDDETKEIENGASFWTLPNGPGFKSR